MIAAEQQQLDGMVALALETLRSDLLGVYLFGSAVLGGLKPVSDLDVLAVTTRPGARSAPARSARRTPLPTGRSTRLPDEHRPVLAQARAIYGGEEDERWDDLEERVRPHTEHVVAAIAELSDG